MGTLIQQTRGWATGRNKSGANGFKLLVASVDHMFEHGDWTPLAWLINGTEGADRTRMRAILGKIAGGITLNTTSKEAREHSTGCKIVMGDNCGPTGDMSIARTLCEENVSFASKRVAEELLNKDVVTSKFDLDKYAKTVFNKLTKEHGDMNAFLAAIREQQRAASSDKVIDH